ncbi:MAG: DnaA/Hda family protein [Alphaproteobacteria bacterium]|nr:DnaA/Hda family protein [Alphaproteobacteria bacterium]
MKSQLFFSFNNQTNLSKSDIVVGEFNKPIVDFLFVLDNWLSNVLYVYGDAGVGKTFISHIFIKENQGAAVSFADISSLENIEKITNKHKLILLEDIGSKSLDDEVNIFNLYNTVLANGSKLILTARESIQDIAIQLPDLRSRLNAAMIFKINTPDEISLKAIFFKMLSDKQLNVSMEVMDYFLKRIHRDCYTLGRLVEKIEDWTMREKKTLNLSTAKNIDIADLV